MGTNYNKIAEEYKQSKLQPWRQYYESYTFFKIAGNFAGLDVLDLACGEGFYTRQIKHSGASNVEGIDLFEGMINLAKENEKENPLGIKYHVGNVATMNLNKKFDVITASYLLNYAQNYEQLLSFAKSIAKHLKPGGKFITINSNPDFIAPPKDNLFKYTFTRVDKGKKEGSEVVYSFYQNDGSHIEVINYHLEKETHLRAFTEAGLTNFKWHEAEISTKIDEDFPEDYWDEILEAKPIIGLTCRL